MKPEAEHIAKELIQEYGKMAEQGTVEGNIGFFQNRHRTRIHRRVHQHWRNLSREGRLDSLSRQQALLVRPSIANLSYILSQNRHKIIQDFVVSVNAPL